MINIVRGDLKNKPISSKELASFFEENASDFDGSLYIGYPIIGTADGSYQIDAMLVCRKKGLVAFHLIEGIEHNQYQDLQDEFHTKIQSKLIQHKNLTTGRFLAIDINIITYAPVFPDGKVTWDPNYPIFNKIDNLGSFIKALTFKQPEFYEPLNAVLQSVTTIRKNRKRLALIENSRGAKLKRLEDSIANLDRTQNAAVIETVEGVQRIRGLAGSGKTIILALKVAYLHAINPNWKIAVTFNTRSLKNQFKKLIRTFTFEHINEEPNWENIDIFHAWGSSSMDGIYYNLCKNHEIEYFDFKSSRSLGLPSGQEFDAVCRNALENIKVINSKYDLIVIDEAQDFSSDFLKICYKLLHDPKRLIYAYDELQSLNKKSMDTPENIFGKDSDGKPYVVLQNKKGMPKQDIVLNTCYRNSKEVLTAAHALGFGIYNNEMVQMFAQTSLWEDIGYRVIDGELEPGKKVTLSRDSETSPDFLTNHSDLDDLISFHTFDDHASQRNFVVKEIEKNIKNDELRPDDIIVINPDPLTTKNMVGSYRSMLFDLDINSNLAGISTSADVFFTDDAVTFTGIFRAKGNEAAMVYLINADHCFSGYELAKKRNILFTAMTRSKAWVRVCGVGSEMKALEKEYQKVKDSQFKLEFNYPTESEMEHMNIVNRDMSPEIKNKIITNKSNLNSLISDLSSGKIRKEDLPLDILEELKKWLV